MVPRLVEGLLGGVGEVKSHLDLFPEAMGVHFLQILFQLRRFAPGQKRIFQKDRHDPSLKAPFAVEEKTVFHLSHPVKFIKDAVPVVFCELFQRVDRGQFVRIIDDKEEGGAAEQFVFQIKGNLVYQFPSHDMLALRVHDQLIFVLFHDHSGHDRVGKYIF